VSITRQYDDGMQSNLPAASSLSDLARLRGRAIELMREEGEALQEAAEFHKGRDKLPGFASAISKVQSIHTERVRVDKLVLALNGAATAGADLGQAENAEA
jgi:hypothetical protein